MLEKDSDLWKVRANDFDFFIEKSQAIPNNQEHLNFLNTLPGYNHNNGKAEAAKQFGFLTMQICAFIKEFDVLTNNNIVLFDPKINYKKEFKDNSWLEDPTFLLIKNDFDEVFDTITLIRKATTILNNKKRQNYYSFLQFLYHNIDQFKIYSTMI